ncbi:tetraacyldisaccharide 4'-kinase [Luteimonas fraxinea]|uniref:Tetraacyldisaccharide 4'-kinase n=1 Tax=Luteimonas fraxinea TaxID=2901869 RepID=A0ABS8UC61_9GAMM|nr:tetraacyldisaccharide 4'-kinase [Luteimonas fraxinea]MCD9097095.1 tetraacyldisaccharide 4'-kinase [Luteimonas fraxinea]UHH09599.1 tetraacyldisaccharide 4'-kinase [Luteimonas fraxinea]
MKAPRYWFDGSRPPLHARALARVYGAASRLRLKFVRPRKVSKPVLVIGNLIAGGSGKTPLAIAIVARLQAAGWTPGVASRGYGRDEAGTPRWVESVTDPKLAGDEPVLIAARTGAKVRVDADRVAAAKALIAAGCDIVVCDDGLQHYRLRRDVEIEVIDGLRRYGNGLLIPAGPMRELATRSADVDFRVLNTGSATDVKAEFGEWPMRLVTGQALPLAGGRALPLSRFSGQRVHAVAGIGDPERFFATLRSHGIAIVPHAFADHHRYTAEDLRFGSDLPVLMTEKDAVKCMRFAGERHYSVPVSGELPEAFWIALLDRLSNLR